MLRAIVDLSMPIGASTPVYPGDPVPRTHRHATIEADGFNLLRVEMGSQSGTHVDAPLHFAADGLSVDQVPLTAFAGPAVVVDLRGIGARQPIGWEALVPYVGRFDSSAIVLLHTGWSDLHATDDTYFDHPYLAPDACDRLLATGVRTIGIDAPSIDETPDADHPGAGFGAHRSIAAAGGVIIENLRALGKIDFPDPFFSAFPIALSNADGAPVRAVAMRFES